MGYNKAADGKRQAKRECKDRRGDVKRQATGYKKTYKEVQKTYAKRNTGVKRKAKGCKDRQKGVQRQESGSKGRQGDIKRLGSDVKTKARGTKQTGND